MITPWEKSVPEDQEALLEQHDAYAPRRSVVSDSLRWQIASAVLSVLLVISVSTHPLFPTSIQLDERAKDVLCNKHTSAFPSPVENDVDFTWNLTPVNGSFKKETIYRHPASPEVDAAWDELGASLKSFIIPEEDGPKYGLHPGQLKRLPELGGGFVAVLDSVHHMHCLNVLRKASHFDWHYYREQGHGLFADPEEWVRLHFSHCLDLLRQHLMCMPDTTVSGQVWVNDFGPLVFANVDRKCRNYDDITNWAREHQELPAKDVLVKKRPGDLEYTEFP